MNRCPWSALREHFAALRSNVNGHNLSGSPCVEFIGEPAKACRWLKAAKAANVAQKINQTSRERLWGLKELMGDDNLRPLFLDS